MRNSCLACYSPTLQQRIDLFNLLTQDIIKKILEHLTSVYSNLSATHPYVPMLFNGNKNSFFGKKV